MFLTIAGAMSTAELGLSLAELIRAGKVHGICSTDAEPKCSRKAWKVAKRRSAGPLAF